MKRRIIAALTALVMVVTMIPASAFAAGNDANTVNDIVKAIGLEDGSFSYKDKQYVLEAHNIFKGLSAEEQAKVSAKGILEDAVNAITVFEDNVAAFKADMAKVTTGSLTSNGSTIEPAEYGKAVTEYKNVIEGSIQGKGKLATVEAITDAKELNSLLGESNVTVISKISVQHDGILKEAINKVNVLNKYTVEEINKLDKVEGTMLSEYNTAKGELARLSDVDYYAYLFAGYDKYSAIASIVEADATVRAEIAKIKPIIGKDYSNNTALTVTDIYNKSKTEGEIAKLEKALADAKALIEKTANIEDIDAAFVKVYEGTQKAYDKYLTKDSVEATIKQLPSKVENANTYAEVVAAYNDWAAIDTDVVAIMNDAVKKVYNDAGDALKAKLKTFNANTIAEDYAVKVNEQIAAIPSIPSRADIAKIDAVIDTLVEYVGVLEAGNFSTGANNAKSVAKLAKKDVFELKAMSVTALAVDSTLAAKLDKGALDKFNAAYAYMKTIATADVETITKVAAYVSNGSGDATITVVNSDKTKADAEKAIADYNTAYAALDATLKADFDKAAADKTKVQFYNVKKNIEAIEKLIAEYGSTDDKVLAAEIARDMEGFVKTFDKGEAKVNTIYYNAQMAVINALDAKMAKDSVKVLVKQNAEGTVYTSSSWKSTNVWDAYNEVKAYMADLVAESYAPTAVINAIDALKVLDEKTVTKSELDSTIVAYEAAEKAYKALTPAEQAKVTNYAKLAEVKDGIVKGIGAVVKAEIAKIGTFDTTNKIPLTDAQKATVNGITVMKDQYKTYVDADAFAALDTDKTYEKALANMKAEISTEAGKEFADVQPMLQDVLAKYYVGGNYKVDKTSAVALINAIDKYNALSDEAKKYAKEKGYDVTYHVDQLAVAADFAKTLVLDYATVEVADVEFNGTPATPAVVVKDFHGNAIDAKEFTVTYSNNDKVGTATVIVTAKADGKYVGTVTKEFKVIGKDLAKVENVKFDTDYGIVRVYFDRTADIDGVDVRYQVQYKKSTSSTWTTKYPTKGLDYLTLKSLTKNGKYDVRVRAYTDDYGTERVYGEYSDVQTVYANRNGAKSGIMYKAVIKSLTTKNGSVTMTVNPVKYTSEPTTVTWKFAYKKYGSQYTTWTTKSSKNTSYTFKNLKKGTRYVFRAQYTYTSAVDGKTAVNSNYSVYKNIVVK